ncbi:unnamed protein product [Amoebophrya sp. A25]|nr:unnamed protein product [Amoebophrya sp. A25]|eukprot:GSA25T00018895001.1
MGLDTAVAAPLEQESAKASSALRLCLLNSESPPSFVDEALTLWDQHWPRQAHLSASRRESILSSKPGGSLPWHFGLFADESEDSALRNGGSRRQEEGTTQHIAGEGNNENASRFQVDPASRPVHRVVVVDHQHATPAPSVFTSCRLIGHAKVSPSIVAGEDAPCGTLYSLVVASNLRGGGIGKAFLDAIIEYLLQKQPKMPYLYLDCKPHLQRFYESVGFRLCPQGSTGTALKQVGKLINQKQVSKLEAMLMARAGAGGGEQDEPPQHQVFEIGKKPNQLYFRRRLLSEWPIVESFFFNSKGQDNEEKLHHDSNSNECVESWVFCLKNFPHQRQIGPSCGMVALNMAAHYLLNLNESTRSSSCTCSVQRFLDTARHEKVSTDGELFSATSLCSVANEVFATNEAGNDNVNGTLRNKLEARVTEDWNRTLQNFLVPKGKRNRNGVEGVEEEGESECAETVFLVPYNKHSATHEPIIVSEEGAAIASTQEHAHWAVIVGAYWSELQLADQQEQMKTDGEHKIETEVAHLLHVVLAHGLSRKLIYCSFDTLAASNANLHQSDDLRGKLVVISKMA